MKKENIRCFINKLVKVILLTLIIFVMLEDLNCLAYTIYAPDPSIGGVAEFSEPTPVHQLIMRGTYNILKVVMIGFMCVNIVIIIVELIENKIKRKEFKISKIFLITFLVFISIFSSLFINETMWEGLLHTTNFEFVMSKLMFAIAQIVLTACMILVGSIACIDLIKTKIICKNKKMNWSYIILLILIFILFGINKSFMVV